MIDMMRMVFTPKYVATSVAITGVMLFGLLLLSEFLFLEPYIIGHIPPGTEVGFVLIVLIATLSGFVIPINIYRITTMRTSKRYASGGFVGTMIGTAAGACSCGPVGFAIISTFGSVGSAASSFLTNFDIPIRIAAVCLLLFTVYTTYRSLKAECSIRR